MEVESTIGSNTEIREGPIIVYLYYDKKSLFMERFRLILSLKSSKLRIFSLKPLIFKLKYIGFQERNRDV